MIGIDFLPKQEILLGVNVDNLTLMEGEKKEATRISIGIIFLTISLVIMHK
jgi:hypothetical protein